MKEGVRRSTRSKKLTSKEQVVQSNPSPPVMKRQTVGPGGVTPFLEKFHSLTETIDPSIAHWTSDGKSFNVIDVERFKDFLGTVFSKSNHATFIRQIHFYGFKKGPVVEPDQEPYIFQSSYALTHPLFHRVTSHESLALIKRGVGVRGAFNLLPAEAVEGRPEAPSTDADAFGSRKSESVDTKRKQLHTVESKRKEANESELEYRNVAADALLDAPGGGNYVQQNDDTAQLLRSAEVSAPVAPTPRLKRNGDAPRRGATKRVCKLAGEDGNATSPASTSSSSRRSRPRAGVAKNAPSLEPLEVPPELSLNGPDVNQYQQQNAHLLDRLNWMESHVAELGAEIRSISVKLEDMKGFLTWYTQSRDKSAMNQLYADAIGLSSGFSAGGGMAPSGAALDPADALDSAGGSDSLLPTDSLPSAVPRSFSGAFASSSGRSLSSSGMYSPSNLHSNSAGLTSLFA